MRITALENDFQELNSYLEEAKPTKIFFLTDENTHDNCLPILLPNLETDAPFEILEIEPGEEMKVLQTAAQLWTILAEFEADRKALFINLGGGVITDLGGFIASTYKRGIRFANIPTSLLAMCDAAIGGKTGIDHGFLKNIVGTFSLPEHTFIHTPFLKSLPFTELRSGFAEMLKHGLIADRKHWDMLINIEALSAENIAPYIWTSAMIKQKIVEQDYKEQNIRKTLNFGHTIGHAVESLFLRDGNVIPHGEAVAMGMICEVKISELEGLINKDDCSSVIKNILRFFPVLDISQFRDDEILSLMLNDKKNTGALISFSLINSIGKCIYDYAPNEKSIISSLDFYRLL